MKHYTVPSAAPDADVDQIHEHLAANHGPKNTLVAQVDDQIVALVGNNLGAEAPHSIQLLDDASTVPDTTSHPAETHPIDDTVAPELIPLFEAPRTWLDTGVGGYNLAAGGIGRVTALSPSGIHFSKYEVIRNHDQHGYYDTLATRFKTNEFIENARVVSSKDEALDVVSRCVNGNVATWISYTPRDEITINEYVQFDSPLETKYDVVVELSRIMDHPPDFNEMFSEIETVLQNQQ